MSMLKHNPPERKPKKAPGRPDARKENRRLLRGNQEPATWEAASPDALHSVVLSVSEAGGFVSFGKTRDGGALYLQVYRDGQGTKDYFRPSDDLDTLLYEIAALFRSDGEYQQKLPL